LGGPDREPRTAGPADWDPGFGEKVKGHVCGPTPFR
jgi:hypothetical protein